MLLLKSELRKKYLSVRKSIDNFTEKNNCIFENLIKKSDYIDSDTIFCYVSGKYEVDTIKIIDYSLKIGKRVACPVCLDENGNMEFRIIYSMNDLSKGMYGILEPRENCEIANSSDKSLCVVPCVCCDLYGYRIGYGKGYYDRFLRNFPGEKILLSFSDCLIPRIPFDENDIKCDSVIQER